MKIEVFSCSTGETIETYSLPDFDLSYFQQWEETLQCLPLCELSNVVEELNSETPKAADLMPVTISVDFYLSAPLKHRALTLFARSQTGEEEFSDQTVEDFRNKIIEGASSLNFKVSEIFSAVVKEILQNHDPHFNYGVKISDG